MGDRANIILTASPSEPPLYFYTHWHGRGLHRVLQEAIRKDNATGEAPEVAGHIAACMSERGDLHISTDILDSQIRSVMLWADHPTRTVRVLACDRNFRVQLADRPVLASFTYEDFAALRFDPDVHMAAIDWRSAPPPQAISSGSVRWIPRPIPSSRDSSRSRRRWVDLIHRAVS